MRVEVCEQPLTALDDYGGIAIAFRVDRFFDVAERRGSPGGFVLRERRIDVPYIKDYDAIENERPNRWASRFDVSNWGVFAARADGRRIGGAVAAFDTPGLDMLEGRADVAVLWDIRVAPEMRGKGIGSALFRAFESWAEARGCRRLKVETQNINVAACRFYARQGCVLATVDRSAYPDLPGEVRLIWHKDLSCDAERPLAGRSEACSS